MASSPTTITSAGWRSTAGSSAWTGRRRCELAAAVDVAADGEVRVALDVANAGPGCATRRRAAFDHAPDARGHRPPGGTGARTGRPLRRAHRAGAAGTLAGRRRNRRVAIAGGRSRRAPCATCGWARRDSDGEGERIVDGDIDDRTGNEYTDGTDRTTPDVGDLAGVSGGRRRRDRVLFGVRPVRPAFLRRAARNVAPGHLHDGLLRLLGTRGRVVGADDVPRNARPEASFKRPATPAMATSAVPTSCCSTARSTIFTERPFTWTRPSSWNRENSRLTVSSFRPRKLPISSRVMRSTNSVDE